MQFLTLRRGKNNRIGATCLILVSGAAMLDKINQTFGIELIAAMQAKRRRNAKSGKDHNVVRQASELRKQAGFPAQSLRLLHI
ncbi:hypothetical protein P7D22_10015 [Lichenihabitans sp. Uapishka_5]|uniref:hypothetical protein n=1 Tax=Lichenihabitans sp. Uapishka_5 TaxID=3037302 RepID=UPI0029E7E34B|nr:hypothetical protein [Lichenihabitans sp. Uapishka_5]MDX7951502.1 hypothetical protein [Lichenihabitans sp. Uapishka_5]